VRAAEITNSSTGFSQLDPMVTATPGELERVGASELAEAVVADAGYWNEQHIDKVTANKHIPVLMRPDKAAAAPPARGTGGPTHGCGLCSPQSAAGGYIETQARPNDRRGLVPQPRRRPGISRAAALVPQSARAAVAGADREQAAGGRFKLHRASRARGIPRSSSGRVAGRCDRHSLRRRSSR
jgi:hypothetical protein